MILGNCLHALHKTGFTVLDRSVKDLDIWIKKVKFHSQIYLKFPLVYERGIQLAESNVSILITIFKEYSRG